MAKKNRKRSKGGLTVDFTGVETGGSGSRVKPGEYIAEVTSVTEEESSEGNPYLKWEMKITEGKYKGARLFHNTSLQPQALWNLRGLLEAMQIEVPDSEMELDLDEYAGQTVGVVVEQETYQGKNQARCVGFFNAEDGADGANDDEEDDSDDSDEDDSDDDSDDSDNEDEDESDEEDDDSEEDDSDDESDDDEDAESDDEDEEEEKPRKRARAAKKGKKGRK